MKNLFFNTAVISAIVLGSTITSCESPDKKVEDAKVKVEDAKEDLSAAQTAANAAALKEANTAAWKVFKAESEMKIKANEMAIADLKAKKKVSGKMVDDNYAKSIDALEQSNKNMKTRMDDYEKSNSDWDAFKREFSHDMDGLGQSIKDLGVNNKK